MGFICQLACLPRHQRLFYELCAYIKSGSPPEGLFPPSPARSRRSSYTGVSGVQDGVRISWRHGMPTGAQGWIYLTAARHASVVTTCGPARRQSADAMAEVRRLMGSVSLAIGSP